MPVQRLRQEMARVQSSVQRENELQREVNAALTPFQQRLRNTAKGIWVGTQVLGGNRRHLANL